MKKQLIALLSAMLFALATSAFAPAGLLADEVTPEPEPAAVVEDVAAEPGEGEPEEEALPEEEVVAPEEANVLGEELPAAEEPEPAVAEAEPAEEELAVEGVEAPAPAAPAADESEGAVLEPQGGGEYEPPANVPELELGARYTQLPVDDEGERWFYFDVDEPTMVWIHFDGVSDYPSDAFVDFTLLGPLEGNSLSRTDVLTSYHFDRTTNGRNSGAVGLCPGRYYLRISGNTHGLSLGAFEVDTEGGYHREQEFNDRFISPYVLDIELNEYYIGSTCSRQGGGSTDTDYWCIHLGTNEDMLVWIEGSTSGSHVTTSTEIITVALQDGLVAEVDGPSIMTSIAIRCNTGNSFNSGELILDANRTYAVRVIGSASIPNYRFKIHATPINVAKATVSGVSNQPYTGSAIKPKPTVKLGGTTLKEGTDYTLSYSNNVNKGTATITIKGAGIYRGTKKVTFKILPSIASATVSKVADQPYTGSAIKPKPTVKMGSTTLKEGTDYTLSYSNNTKAGTATITITGKGGYAGTKKVTFKIVAPSVTYRVHVQTYGWQGWKKDGAMAGTSGQSKRLEGINIKLATAPYSGGITYRVHVQRIGWQGWRSNGAMAGTEGQSLRLEAIQIKLTGEMAQHYDVYYRVHAQHFGWMGWAKNGQSAGTAGYAYRLEAIEIRIVPKGAPAPGSTANRFKQK